MKKLFVLAAALMTMAACTNEDPFLDVSSDLTTSISAVQQSGLTYSFSIETNENWTITTDNQTWYSFDKLEGTGSAEVTITVTENNTVEPRTATFTVATASFSQEFTITQAGASASSLLSELLIEEIFYAKNAVVETGVPDTFAGDQYIKITNTTDHVVYADRLMIAESYIFTDQSSICPTTYDPDKRPTHCPVGLVFVVPGDGDDYPIEAGASILVAATAQDYTVANSNSMDLSNVDFEWFDQSTVEGVADTDNPNVDNVEIWFTPSLTLSWFNMQGNKGYLIARVPENVTAESFLADYKWTGMVIEDWSDFEMGMMESEIEKAYLVPNEWVLDAVNIGHDDSYTNLAFDSSLDAGYTYCGSDSYAVDRYGKAVIRKRNNGVLVDTNNSTSDFTPHTTPSVKIGK